MFPVLLRLEWRNLKADRLPLLVAALLAGAIGYGTHNGARWVAFQRTAIAEALAEENQRLAAISAEIPILDAGRKKVTAFADPRLPQSLGRNMGLRYATMPPANLGPLAIGQTDIYPYYIKVSTNSLQSFANNDEIENPVHLLAGRFDLAFVILLVLPLAVLGVSYDVLSADREAGILALTLSQPARLHTVLAAKLTVRAALVLTMTILPALAGVILGGVDPGADGAALRFLQWLGITVAYSLFWFALAVGVNLWKKSSATNAALLSGAWLVLAIIIPSLLTVAAREMYPVPSRVEMIQAMRVAGDEASRKSSQLMARFLEDHPELAPPPAAGREAPDFGTLLVAVNEATEKSVQPVLEHFERQRDLQQSLVERLRYLSPAILAQGALYDVAGASPHRHRHFMTQVAAYHREWRGFFTPRILKKQPVTAGDIGRLPEFRFVEESASAVTARLAPAFAGLVASVLLAALPAFAALRRYRPVE